MRDSEGRVVHDPSRRHNCRPLNVIVVQRRCNYSAFNGYHRTPSDYSLVQCLTCGHLWRTKADFVHSAPDGAIKLPHELAIVTTQQKG